MNNSPDFMPAAGYRFLTPFYECVVALTIGKTWKGMASEVARLAPQGGKV